MLLCITAERILRAEIAPYTRGVTTTKLRLVVVPGSTIKLSSVINFISLLRISSIYCRHLTQREFNLIVCILRIKVVA
jgi:hypothetical protein